MIQRRGPWMSVVVMLVLGACSQRVDAPLPNEMAASPPSRVPVHAAGSDAGDAAAVRRLLPASIAIETLGGISTVLIPRGTPLPARQTEKFSTAADDQRSVEIHVVAGERQLVRDNRSLGKVQLTGIPPALRGVPEIEVSFAVDADGIVTVTARDLATNAVRTFPVGSLQESASADPAAGHHVDTRLFSTDLPLDAMPLSLALEQLDGSRMVLVPRGTRLPAQRTEIVATAVDRQRSLGIHLVLGEQPRARDNRDAGTFTLSDLRPGAGGEQQFAVTFLVHTDGSLVISAKDRATGNGRSLVEQEPATSSLDGEAIERELARAGLARDRPRRELAAAHQRLDLLTREVRSLLANPTAGLPDELRARCERAIADAERQRASSDLAALREITAALRTTSHEATTALYRSARATGRGAP